jgi:hypothetical protein
MVAASPDVFTGDWTTYNVIDGDKNLGVCRLVEMGVSRWSTRLLMRSEHPDAGGKDVHPVLAWFIRNFHAALMRLSQRRRAYVDQLFEALEPPAPSFATAIDEFCTNGRLKLVLEPRLHREKLQSYEYRGVEYSIAAGLYIFPWARHVLARREANHLAGLMFDTTWEVMWAYVTSILVAVRQNTVFPVAFAFGAAETTELYELFYEEFGKLEVNLCDFVAESDQGSALMALFKKYKNLHLICLHHFLRTLKDRHFAVYVASLVKARVEGEFDRLCKRFVAPLLAVLADNGNSDEIKSALNKEFAKAGLVFDGHTISVGASAEFSERWRSISMLARAETDMPPTTGALESTHGHLNEATGRVNSFWPSMCRLKKQGEQSFKSWGTRVCRNLAAACRRSEGQFKWLGDDIARQVAFFGTTVDSCSCGQTEHLSKMFGVNVPCPHQLAVRHMDLSYLGPSRPKLAEVPTIEWTDLDHGEFYIECQVTPGRPRTGGNTTRDILKQRAVEQIRRFSKAKKKTIIPWVEREFPADLGNEFALGMPLKVVDHILAGVRHFT